MDIVARARNIVQTPQQEWPVIAAEPADIGGLYTQYVVILAAIPLVAELIRYVVGGLSFGTAIVIPVIGYVVSLVDVALFAFIAAKLAPTFGGNDNLIQGFKLAAYGATPRWLGGVFFLVPWIGWILRLLCDVYGIYLVWLGIPELMQVPAERRVGYLVVMIVAFIVVAWIIAMVLFALVGFHRLGVMH